MSDDETANRRKANLSKKTGFLSVPLFRNLARGFHHGLTATAVHSRESGYIRATVLVKGNSSCKYGTDQNGTKLRHLSMVSTAMRGFNHLMPMGCK